MNLLSCWKNRKWQGIFFSKQFLPKAMNRVTNKWSFETGIFHKIKFGTIEILIFLELLFYIFTELCFQKKIFRILNYSDIASYIITEYFALKKTCIVSYEINFFIRGARLPKALNVQNRCWVRPSSSEVE